VRLNFASHIYTVVDKDLVRLRIDIFRRDADEYEMLPMYEVRKQFEVKLHRENKVTSSSSPAWLEVNDYGADIWSLELRQSIFTMLGVL